MEAHVRTKDKEAFSDMDAPIQPLTAGNSSGAFLGIKDSKKDSKEKANCFTCFRRDSQSGGKI